MKAKTAFARPSRVGQVDLLSSSVCNVAKKLSATELSKQSPMEPIDPNSPVSRSQCPNAQLV